MWDNWKHTLNNWKNLHENVDRLHRLGGLRIWILHVLGHGPKNGVEIMDAIEEHYNAMYKARSYFMEQNCSGKHYNMHLKKTMKRKVSRPSPGSVYPMLKKMVSEDLIVKLDDGRYDLTETGRETISDIFGDHRHRANYRSHQSIENALEAVDNYITYLEDMKKDDLLRYHEIISSLNERFSKIEDSLK